MPRRRTLNPLMTALGALSSGASCAFFSNDSCCTAVGAAVLGAFLGGLIERAIIHHTTFRRRPRAFVRATVIVALGFSLGLFFRLDQSATFEQAFGVRPPAGVHDLRIKRYYGGGTDYVVLIRFVADETTMQQILSARPFTEDTEWRQELSPEHDWSKILNHVFSSIALNHGGKQWEFIPPMSNPKIYMWRSPVRAMEEVRVLWEPSSGKVYAMQLN